MRGSRRVVRGRGSSLGPTDKKSSDHFLFCLFLILNFQRVSNGLFQENYNFPRFQGVLTFFGGGGGGGGFNFVMGVQLLIPIETYRTCGFQGVRVRTPCVCNKYKTLMY